MWDTILGIFLVHLQRQERGSNCRPTRVVQEVNVREDITPPITCVKGRKHKLTVGLGVQKSTEKQIL